MSDLEPVRRALVSVSDKTGVVELCHALGGAWGGAAVHGRHVRHAAGGGAGGAGRGGPDGVPRDDGRPGEDAASEGAWRVARAAGQAAHMVAMAAHGIVPIDLLVVNLYPFEATVARGAEYDDCIENIDIGGPAMIRAAAKNHAFVNVVVDVEDYAPLLAEMDGAWRGGRRWPSGSGSRRRPMRGRRPMMRRCRRGWRARSGRRRPGGGPSRGRCGRRCAMARTRIRGPRSMRTARGGPAWLRPCSGRARNSVLQQHQRHGCGVRAGGGVRARGRAGLRDHQARESLRRGAGGDAGRGLCAGLRLRPDLAPSAGSWR